MADTVRVLGCVQEDESSAWSDALPLANCSINSTYYNRMFFDMPAPTVSATECPEGHMCSIPELSATDGLLIAGAIGGVWALGLIARLFIRAQQQGMHD